MNISCFQVGVIDSSLVVLGMRQWSGRWWLALVAIMPLVGLAPPRLDAGPPGPIAAAKRMTDDTAGEAASDPTIAPDDVRGEREAPLGPQPVGWFDNLSAFGGLDGSKGPEDLGINANFGGRASVNWGFPIFEVAGVGGQLGTGINYSRTAVTVLETIDGTRERMQSFTTVGLFQRTERGLVWALAYDYLFEDYYARMNMGQWRGQCGWTMNDKNEMGMWGTVGNWGDKATVGGFGFHMEPITQGNMYMRHIWRSEAVTAFWVGLAEKHHRFVIVNPGAPATHFPFVFGANLYVPLNDHVALYGEANFITPNDTGTVTATLGFAFFPGGRAWSAARNRFAPVLPVANNPTFAVDLER